MKLDRAWLARAMYYFAADWINADIRSQEHADLFSERYQEITAAATQYLSVDRDNGESNAEEDERLFDEFLKAGGMSPEECVKGHNLRRNIVKLAVSLLDAPTEPERDPGNDPGCDVGGGVIDPDDRDRNDPW